MPGALVPAALTAAATWLAFPPVRSRPAGAVGETGPPQPSDVHPAGFVEDPRRRAALCAVAAGVVGWAAFGVLGALAGVVAGLVVSRWLGRLELPSAARDRVRVERDLPLAVDLLAACADVGLPVQASVAPVGRAVGGPVGARLLDVSARLELGADPVLVWSRLGDDPAFAGFGHAMLRAHRSGAPVVDVLSRLSADRRRDLRTRSQATARAVGVKVAAPLAVCFLPAFMLIGVVPTIVGGLSHLGL
ncbi:MAG: type II secretion system F family protein [Nocardioidaceae bacterium]